MKKIFSFIKNKKHAFLWHGRRYLGLDNTIEIKSPTINSNNSVTVRLLAKKAKQVKIEGEWMPANGWYLGNANMIKNKSGVWEYTSDVLNPDVYRYSFIVDGVQALDPNNVYVLRDVGSIKNAFIIGGGEGELFKTKAESLHGIVEKRWYNHNGINRRVTVYTPPGYEDNDKNYPVLYLLHGAGGDEDTWCDLGRVPQIMDNLISLDKITPMIVVMPNGIMHHDAAPEESSQGFYNPEFDVDTDSSEIFESSFHELIRYVDKNYRTLHNKSNQAIAGLSLGANQAFLISQKLPNRFDFVGLFSYTRAFSKEINLGNKELQDSLKNLFNLKPELYWLAVGINDTFYDTHLMNKKYLDSKEYGYLSYEINSSGHTWTEWRHYLIIFLQIIFKK